MHLMLQTFYTSSILYLKHFLRHKCISRLFHFPNKIIPLIIRMLIFCLNFNYSKKTQTCVCEFLLIDRMPMMNLSSEIPFGPHPIILFLESFLKQFWTATRAPIDRVLEFDLKILSAKRSRVRMLDDILLRLIALLYQTWIYRISNINQIIEISMKYEIIWNISRIFRILIIILILR